MELIHSSPTSSLFSHCFLLHKGSSVRRDGVRQGRGVGDGVVEQGVELGAIGGTALDGAALLARHLIYQ